MHKHVNRPRKELKKITASYIMPVQYYCICKFQTVRSNLEFPTACSAQKCLDYV